MVVLKLNELTQRPEYELTAVGLEELQVLSKLGCTLAEIAAHMHVSHKWLAEYVEENDEIKGLRDAAVADLKKRTRKAQIEIAEGGNATMAIWLGKQLLGQSDKQEIEIKKTVQVVGTMPDFKAAGEDWMKNFAPPPPKLAAPTPIAPAAPDAMDLTEVPTDAAPSD